MSVINAHISFDFFLLSLRVAQSGGLWLRQSVLYSCILAYSSLVKEISALLSALLTQCIHWLASQYLSLLNKYVIWIWLRWSCIRCTNLCVYSWFAIIGREQSLEVLHAGTLWLVPDWSWRLVHCLVKSHTLWQSLFTRGDLEACIHCEAISSLLIESQTVLSANEFGGAGLQRLFCLHFIGKLAQFWICCETGMILRFRVDWRISYDWSHKLSFLVSAGSLLEDFDGEVSLLFVFSLFDLDELFFGFVSLSRLALSIVVSHNLLLQLRFACNAGILVPHQDCWGP